MLAAKQKEFLKNYCPENTAFTSDKEQIKILDVLNNDCSIEMRNAVVLYYAELMKAERGLNNPVSNDKVFNLSIAMCSVTAVIDYHINYNNCMY